MIKFSSLPALAIVALTLVGCEGQRAPEPDPAPTIDRLELPKTELSALTAKQQMRRAEFNRSEFDKQYRSLREEIGTLPPRSEMNFKWLDRDADGSLSSAEYALRALSDTVVPVGDEEVTGLTETYYLFDENADGALSAAEFEAALTSNLI